jgi:hypothetical protein
MEITFEGHEPAIRTVEPSPLDLLHFKDAVKSLALNAVEHYTWEGPFYPEAQRAFVDLCEKFSVDHTYKRDRVAFANALIELL